MGAAAAAGLSATRDWIYLVAQRRDRKLKLDRELRDDCRALDHRACSHIGSGGGLRTEYVVVCSCLCHDGCASIGKPLAEMRNLCDCYETRKGRQRDATEAGVKARPRHVIRRGTPDDYTETSIGFIIGGPIVVGLFVAAVVSAIRTSGVVRVVSAIVAVVLGLLIGWTALLFGFVGLLARLIRKVKNEA